MLYSLFLVSLSVSIYTAYGCVPRNIPEDCIVSENPRTTVVKTNDTAVNISCGINRDHVELIIDEFFTFDAIPYLEDHQITPIDFCSMEVQKCSISIPAIKENDGLRIQCVEEECCTDTAVIHVVDGIPDPPDAPTVHSINSTSLNVTWSSPWEAPVNYYVLSIVTNSEDTTNISVNGNSYIVNRPDNFNCATYSFSISASTDIGDTDFSEPSFGNFSTDLNGAANFMNESFTETFKKYECGSTSTYKITVEALDMCPHETFEYQFEVSSVEHATRDPLIVTPNSDSPMFFFVVDAQIQSSEYDMTAFIFNGFGESLNISETIDLSMSYPVTDYPPITELTTTVALLDTNATFTCSKGVIDGASLFVIVNNTIISNTDSLMSTTHDGNYTITIPARIENNSTTIRCFIAPCFSKEVMLIVVNSLPDSIKRPSVARTSNTSILISWSPPWSHPINGYQLTVINNTGGRNQQVEQYSIQDDSFVLINPSGFECNHLSLVVQAYTDLGITPPDNFKNVTFFKGLMNLDTITTSKQYQFREGNVLDPPTLAVNFLPPPVCEQETLSYEFMLTNLILNEVLTLKSLNSSTEFKLSNNFLRDDDLKLAVAVNVLDGLANATVQLFDSINIKVSRDVSPTTQSQVIIVSTVGGASFLLILLAVAIASFVCFYWYRRSVKHKRVRSDGTHSVSDAMNFQLPPMIVNTQYATADEVLYESINEYCAYSTIPDHFEAPHLPPPRAISDKLTSSDSSTDIQDKDTGKKVDDEYVQMTRVGGKMAAVDEGSPRYVPGPMMNRMDEDEETTTESAVFEYGNGTTTVL